MYVSQLLFPCRQGEVGVQLGSTAEQVCSLVEALLAHQASSQPLTQATGNPRAQARPALHIEASSAASCRNDMILCLAMLLIHSLSHRKWHRVYHTCFALLPMLKSHVGTPWADTGDRHVVEQLVLELVSSTLSCPGHSIQLLSQSIMSCV